jgi:hypothetical protein
MSRRGLGGLRAGGKGVYYESVVWMECGGWGGVVGGSEGRGRGTFGYRVGEPGNVLVASYVQIGQPESAGGFG